MLTYGVTSGGIDITATGAAGKDIDVTCTSGSNSLQEKLLQML